MRVGWPSSPVNMPPLSPSGRHREPSGRTYDHAILGQHPLGCSWLFCWGLLGAQETSRDLFWDLWRPREASRDLFWDLLRPRVWISGGFFSDLFSLLSSLFSLLSSLFSLLSSLFSLLSSLFSLSSLFCLCSSLCSLPSLGPNLFRPSPPFPLCSLLSSLSPLFPLLSLLLIYQIALRTCHFDLCIRPSTSPPTASTLCGTIPGPAECAKRLHPATEPSGLE